MLVCVSVSFTVLAICHFCLLTIFLSSQPNDSQLDWDTFSSIRTGTDDLEVVGQFVTWRGMHTLPYWNGTDANMINGTDGTLAHPYLNKDEDVIMFVDNLFRLAVARMRTHLLYHTANNSSNRNLFNLSESFINFSNPTFGPDPFVCPSTSNGIQYV